MIKDVEGYKSCQHLFLLYRKMCLIRVSVTDTGCGMTEKTKKHIFKKFKKTRK